MNKDTERVGGGGGDTDRMICMPPTGSLPLHPPSPRGDTSPAAGSCTWSACAAAPGQGQGQGQGQSQGQGQGQGQSQGQGQRPVAGALAEYVPPRGG